MNLDYSSFLDKLNGEVEKLGIDLKEFKLDHLAYQTKTSDEYDLLKKELAFYELRHLVRPGITGWAQIHYRYGASVEDAHEKLQYEMYYLKNRSLILDLIIVLKTIKFFFVSMK